MVSYSICLVLSAAFLGAQGYLVSESASATHQFKTLLKSDDSTTCIAAIKFVAEELVDGIAEWTKCMVKGGSKLKCLFKIAADYLHIPFFENYRYCGLEAEAEELASPINALDAACREHGQGQALADKAMSLARQVETVDDEQRQAACVVSILADFNSDQDLSLGQLSRKVNYCIKTSKFGFSLEFILEKVKEYILKKLKSCFGISNMKLSSVNGIFEKDIGIHTRTYLS